MKLATPLILPNQTSPNNNTLQYSHTLPVEEKNVEEGKMREVENEKEEIYHVGKWTKEEHTLFMDAFNTYGKNWKKIQECVATRSITQVRSHAQKCLPNQSNGSKSPKEQANTESPITPTKISLPKTRKRVQSGKSNGIKKVKLNPETPLQKPELYPEPTALLANSGVIYNATIDPILSSAIYYQTGNEVEKENDEGDFEFDFSEAEIKPLDLEEREVRNMWKSTEVEEEIVNNLII